MTEWSPLDWILGCVSIASLALFLLDRAHRNALKVLKEACDEHRLDQQILIDTLQELLRVREEIDE